jgi:hypothetical protein
MGWDLEKLFRDSALVPDLQVVGGLFRSCFLLNSAAPSGDPSEM